MAKPTTSPVSIKTITTSGYALRELRILDGQLDELGLGQFRLFNSAYCIVTENIQRAIEEKDLEDPSLISTFIVTFVGYYFHALNDITTGHLGKSSPWSSMNQHAKIPSAPVFLSLLIGANAHINHDLPHALALLSERKGTEPSIGDIAKINKLLMKSGKEIILSFDETNKFYDFLKRRLQFAYYRPAMYTILYWRVIAWRNYKRLMNSKVTEVRIARRSHKIAKRLLRISRILAS